MMDIVEQAKDFVVKNGVNKTSAFVANLIDEIERLREALQKIAEYEIEEGCLCSACEHSGIARSALQQKESE